MTAAPSHQLLLAGSRFLDNGTINFFVKRGASCRELSERIVFLSHQVGTKRQRLADPPLVKLFPGQLESAAAGRLFGSADDLRRLAAGEDPAAIAASWSGTEARWRALRAKYLVY